MLVLFIRTNSYNVFILLPCSLEIPPGKLRFWSGVWRNKHAVFTPRGQEGSSSNLVLSTLLDRFSTALELSTRNNAKASLQNTAILLRIHVVSYLEKHSNWTIQGKRFLRTTTAYFGHSNHMLTKFAWSILSRHFGIMAAPDVSTNSTLNVDRLCSNISVRRKEDFL